MWFSFDHIYFFAWFAPSILVCIWLMYLQNVFLINFLSAVSRLCVSHRKRAKDIVETWNKLFSSSQKDQRVPFLNLANDILQNSRRKGSEFVNEFWKVLPSALKRVYASDEPGKKSVIRLVSPILICHKSC
jgi:regulator of Ty1 transposition protein 103